MKSPLGRLMDRAESLEKEVAFEKTRLRDLSPERKRIRNRVVGSVVIELVAKRMLPETVVDVLKTKLLAATEGNNKEFEAFQGSPLDLTDLLRELSDPVE
jgi:hypothetical protein